MIKEKWDGKVPDRDLEPIGAEKKEAQEPSVEEVPSFAELRVAEIAKEATVITPEDPGKKAAQIETLRLSILTPNEEIQHEQTEAITQSGSPNIVIEHYNEERREQGNRVKMLLDKKYENLQKRVRGEISGVELDRLDKDLDEGLKKAEAKYSQAGVFEKPEEKIGGIVEETQKQESSNTEVEQSNPETERFAGLRRGLGKTNEEEKKLEPHSSSFENADNLTEEIKNEHTIRRAYDFDSLMKAIDKVGDITGSDGYVYKPDYLKDVVGEVFVERKPLNYVTGTFGLRDKVRALLEARQSEMDRRAEEEREKQLKSPEEKMKDKIFEAENLRQLREYRDGVEKASVPVAKEKKSRSIFNR